MVQLAPVATWPWMQLQALVSHWLLSLVRWKAPTQLEHIGLPCLGHASPVVGWPLGQWHTFGLHSRSCIVVGSCDWYSCDLHAVAVAAGGAVVAGAAAVVVTVAVAVALAAAAGAAAVAAAVVIVGAAVVFAVGAVVVVAAVVVVEAAGSDASNECTARP